MTSKLRLEETIWATQVKRGVNESAPGRGKASVKIQRKDKSWCLLRTKGHPHLTFPEGLIQVQSRLNSASFVTSNKQGFRLGDLQMVKGNWLGLWATFSLSHLWHKAELSRHQHSQTWSSCSSNLNVLVNHLRIMQKHKFWFRRSGVRPGSLHFQRSPRGCPCSSFLDHSLCSRI